MKFNNKFNYFQLHTSKSFEMNLKQINLAAFETKVELFQLFRT